MHLGLYAKCPTFLYDFAKCSFLLDRFLIKVADIKFHENLSSASRDDTCGRPEDTMKTTNDFRAYAKAPENDPCPLQADRPAKRPPVCLSCHFVRKPFDKWPLGRLKYTSRSHPGFLLAGPFWLLKTTTDPHILAHESIVSGWWISKIKNVYLRTDFK
jgi:hypothetical protein